MRLAEVLAQKKKTILERCLNLLLGTYPRDSATLLKNRQDPFTNPVGSTFRRELEVVLDGLVASADPGSLTPSLDAIVRIRAVQDFRPSEALAFMAYLKKTIRDELQEVQMSGQALDDLAGLDARIDELTLAAFDLYVACREKIADIRVGEARAERDRLVKVVQAMGQSQGQGSLQDASLAGVTGHEEKS